MPSVTRRPSAGRAVRRRESQARLLSTLEALLSGGEPFTTLTVDRLIEEAGVPRSTFYLLYPDKAHLLRDLTGGLAEEFLAASRAWWELAPGAGIEELHAAFDGMLRAYQPHRLLMAAVMESSAYDAEVGEAYRDVIARHQEQVAAHIVRGRRGGSIRADIDAERTAVWLTRMIERGLQAWAGATDGAAREQALRAWTRIVWNALYATPA